MEICHLWNISAFSFICQPDFYQSRLYDRQTRFQRSQTGLLAETGLVSDNSEPETG